MAASLLHSVDYCIDLVSFFSKLILFLCSCTLIQEDFVLLYSGVHCCVDNKTRLKFYPKIYINWKNLQLTAPKRAAVNGVPATLPNIKEKTQTNETKRPPIRTSVFEKNMLSFNLVFKRESSPRERERRHGSRLVFVVLPSPLNDT